MAVTAHVFPFFTQLMTEGDQTHNVNLQTGTVDTCGVALYTGSGLTWNSTLEGATTQALFAAGDGTHALTEVSGTGYTTGGTALTSVGVTTSGLVTTLTCASPAWTTATFTASYALFFDTTAGSAGTFATAIPMCYWDFGGAQSVSGATFTLTISGSGLVTWTSS